MPEKVAGVVDVIKISEIVTRKRKMKRIYISALGLFSFYQIQAQQIKTDSASVGKLKVDEVNLVSSYYKQDGNNSAVTGGIGTEKLISGEYNSDVFAFEDSGVRKLLADIQVEEQNHAEMLYKYKTANGMF